jgi:hypothetical protein
MSDQSEGHSKNSRPRLPKIDTGQSLRPILFAGDWAPRILRPGMAFLNPAQRSSLLGRDSVKIGPSILS